MAIDKKIQDIFSEQPYDGFRILDRLISVKPSLNLDNLMAVDNARRIHEEYRESLMKDFEHGKPTDRTAEKIFNIPYYLPNMRSNDPNPEMGKLYYYLGQISPSSLFLRAFLYARTLENYGKTITRHEKRRLDRLFVPFEIDLGNEPKKPLPQAFPDLSRAIEDACSYLMNPIHKLDEEIRQRSVKEGKEQYRGISHILHHVWKNETASILSLLRYSI